GNGSDSLTQDTGTGHLPVAVRVRLACCPVPSDARHRQGVTWGASIGVAGPRAVAGVRLPLELRHFAVSRWPWVAVETRELGCLAGRSLRVQPCGQIRRRRVRGDAVRALGGCGDWRAGRLRGGGLWGG